MWTQRVVVCCLWGMSDQWCLDGRRIGSTGLIFHMFTKLISTRYKMKPWWVSLCRLIGFGEGEKTHRASNLVIRLTSAEYIELINDRLSRQPSSTMIILGKHTLNKISFKKWGKFWMSVLEKNVSLYLYLYFLLLRGEKPELILVNFTSKRIQHFNTRFKFVTFGNEFCLLCKRASSEHTQALLLHVHEIGGKKEIKNKTCSKINPFFYFITILI